MARIALIGVAVAGAAVAAYLNRDRLPELGRRARGALDSAPVRSLVAPVERLLGSRAHGSGATP